jgi:hypothetical protein
MVSFNEFGVMVTVPLACGKQLVIPGEGIILKVNEVAGLALLL